MKGTKRILGIFLHTFWARARPANCFCCCKWEKLNCNICVRL